ncbi:MAG: glucose-1-phosphate adenylyltransferase [Anaerolineae bacterium]|nr:glucose-1-phosphate adenylyltransferase [Anaerolineae bacterium]
MKVRAVILAGGEGTRLKVLTVKRAKPAVPFAGKYRMIDFPLSNCVNSGIFDVLVLTQYRPHSLNDHIARGRPWDLDRSFSGGVQLLQPFKGKFDTDWYSGTADAVTQNWNFVRRGSPDYVLILSGDHVYQMNYNALIRAHIENEAEATVCTIPVPLDEASRYGIVDVDKNNRVKNFIEKPPNPPGNLANMGVYLFSLEALEKYLLEDAEMHDSDHDFGKNILPRMVASDMNVFAYPFMGYWIDVGTLDAYWSAHMDLLDHPPSLDLNDRSWVIHTRSEERPPVHIEAGAQIKDSLITDGSFIAPGAIVERSVLSPGVYVGPGAVVRESIILTDTYIDAEAVVERSVVDKLVMVGKNARIGEKRDVGDLGLSIIGKNTRVPAEAKIGCNCVLGTDLSESHFARFPGLVVPDDTNYTIKE